VAARPRRTLPNEVLLQLIPSFFVFIIQGVSRRVRSLEYSAALGAEADRVLASDQSTSAIPESTKGGGSDGDDAAYVDRTATVVLASTAVEASGRLTNTMLLQ
jgi:hypothetical protein